MSWAEFLVCARLTICFLARKSNFQPGPFRLRITFLTTPCPGRCDVTLKVKTKTREPREIQFVLSERLKSRNLLTGLQKSVLLKEKVCGFTFLPHKKVLTVTLSF